jgi:hypothetical protein
MGESLQRFKKLIWGTSMGLVCTGFMFLENLFYPFYKYDFKNLVQKISNMKQSMDNQARNLAAICLLGLLLGLTACEDSGKTAGPPGSHRFAGPPGAPVGPGASSAKNSAVSPVASAPHAASPTASPASNSTSSAAPTAPNNPAAPDAKNSDPSANQPNKPGLFNPLASLNKVEEAGNLLSLASEMIGAGTNPFLSRLPKPILPESSNAEVAQPDQTAAPAVANPLDSIKLVGIVYSSISPIALVAIDGAQQASQLVHLGDSITLGGARAIVRKITQSTIDIQATDNTKEKRTVNIPDIIGYGAPKTDSASSEATNSAAADPSATRATASSSGASTPSPGSSPLENLKKLADVLTGKKSSSGKASDVVLTEP